MSQGKCDQIRGFQELERLRGAYGLRVPPGQRFRSRIKQFLKDEVLPLFPSPDQPWPKNGPLLNELVIKFESLGFKWRVQQNEDRKWIAFDNYPVITGVEGYWPNLLELYKLPTHCFQKPPKKKVKTTPLAGASGVYSRVVLD